MTSPARTAATPAIPVRRFPHPRLAGPGVFSRFTISCGVASTESHGTDRVNLVRAADRALYRAKDAGRNRVAEAEAEAEAAEDAAVVGNA